MGGNVTCESSVSEAESEVSGRELETLGLDIAESGWEIFVLRTVYGGLNAQKCLLDTHAM